MDATLGALLDQGQSVWLDYIRRSLIERGGLDELVSAGIRGVTSNPSIFEKAIAGSDDYDDDLRDLLSENPNADAETLFERLALDDIRAAADVLHPVYEASDRSDGFVSLEVSPELADDTGRTINEARRLWAAVDRPNLMIKVPATPAGIPAIGTLIGEGINVNVTLMFSLDHYEAVAGAYLRGLESADDPSRVASVASFFVSRVDTKVDAALEANGSEQALGLRGRIAVANSKIVYRRFREIFDGEPFAALRKAGARPQRVLWASTSTKNPAYSDVLYVEELIAPNTVNTMPPATLEAFRDHGMVPGPTATQGVSAAAADVAALAELGVDLDEITELLQVEGVEQFASAHRALLDAIRGKCAELRAGRSHQRLSLGGYRPAVDRRLKEWEEAQVTHRIWAKDHTVWSSEPQAELTDRLGWLTLPETMPDAVDDLAAFADEVRADGVSDVVLLGMGGSSLAPEVFQSTFGSAPGFPRLHVLDSTHPEAVAAVDDEIDPATTLFIVASKSGTTLETLSFFRYFWQRTAQSVDDPGRHFVAITDPGTPLVDLAKERGFRRIFEAPNEVGGRYSALTPFGLVPAALIGADVGGLLDRADVMCEAGGYSVAETHSPALQLGAALGELAQVGRDKATYVVSRSLRAFPVWVEQLIAESTGKAGMGIVPVAGEPLGPPDVYGDDRFFLSLVVDGDPDDFESALAALEAAGHPVARIRLADPLDLGQEIYRAELAVATAGVVLGINPFDQPDVQLAKDLAKRAMAGDLDTTGVEQIDAADREGLAVAATRWLADARAGDYLAVNAFLAPTDATTEALQGIRVALRDRLRVATTVGFGPRFLHSTGQLHKGGPNTGLFLQLVDRPAGDLAVPESDFTFGELIAGQALGDYQALRSRDRRVLRVDLGADVAAGLASVGEALGVT